MERTGAFLSQGKIRGLDFLKEKPIVFVTVGTDPQPFDRLLKEIDRLASQKFFSSAVFCQTGYSKYIPKQAESKAFLDFQEFENKIRQADLVITHGGAGSIGACLQHHKKCIVVPRLKKFGEHANDHQLELVDSMEKKGMVIGVYDEKKLAEAIRKASEWKERRFEAGKKIVELVQEFAERSF